MEIKLTPNDLARIKDVAQRKFLDESNAGLDHSEFVAKCYFDAVADFLYNRGIAFTVQYQHKQRLLDSVGDED